MTRKELRAIQRRLLGADSARISNAEINSVANGFIREMARDVGGVLKEADVSTDAYGFADISGLTDLLRIQRVVYEDTSLREISMSDI